MSLTVHVAVPLESDAEQIVELLRQDGLRAEPCTDASRLLDSFRAPQPVGTHGGSHKPHGPLLIAEEMLSPEVINSLSQLVREQPVWSDFPVLVLTAAGRAAARGETLEKYRAELGTPVLIERPLRQETLVSAVRAAVRARQRQYEVRDAMADRDHILAELRTERETLKVMLDNLPVGVLLARATGEIVQANDTVERILRHPILPTPDIEAHGAWISYHPDGSRVRAEEYPLVRAIQTGQVIAPEELLYERGDGTKAWTSISAAPIRDEHGIVVAGVAALVDIDDRKRAEAALVQSEKLAAVGRLAASISHEINNPLEAVTNLLYLIRQEDSLPERATTYLSLAERELARVSQIAGQTLRFHRQATRPTDVTPEELLESVIGLYQGRLSNANIKIVFQHRGSDPVTCYEGDIRQVLNNLVGNALDSMRSGGRLLVRTHNTKCWRTHRDGIRITIADTGYGMSPEVRARIFEAFYTTKGLSGTGLGLWISHGIIEKHHGRLTVRSSNQGERTGTVFSLFLPRHLQPAA
jgi:PAS domain S-box-containing protein